MEKDKMLPVNVPLDQYPCRNQTAKEVEAYYRGVAAGDLAVVRHTQGRVLRYNFDRVSGTKPRSGRVYLEQQGAFYAKSGKNCEEPTGQSTLVVPTLQILEWGEGYTHATRTRARGLSLEDVKSFLSGRIERLPPPPPPQLPTVEECRGRVERAEQQLAGLQGAWDNYSGNNPNKYRSDLKWARQELDWARSALKAAETAAATSKLSDTY